MAIDSARKRRAAAAASGTSVAPLPDGTIDAGDRGVVTGIYWPTGQATSTTSEGYTGVTPRNHILYRKRL